MGGGLSRSLQAENCTQAKNCIIFRTLKPSSDWLLSFVHFMSYLEGCKKCPCAMLLSKLYYILSCSTTGNCKEFLIKLMLQDEIKSNETLLHLLATRSELPY